MTFPTLPLGRKRDGGLVSIEERLSALERSVQQIPSRYPNQPPSLSRVVTQTAHGFTVGKVVARGATTWALAVANAIYEPMGLVIAVLDVNTFVVALRGYFYVPGLVPLGEALAVTDWTVYTLNPASSGNFGSDDHVSSVVPSTGATLRSVFTTLDKGWIEVHGPVTDAHDHPFEFATNVLRPVSGFSSGQVIVYDPDCFGTAVAGWKAQSISAALGNRSALSVFGNSTNAAAPGADIGPAPANAVLGCNAAGTALMWGSVGTLSITNGAVTAAKLGTDVTLEALKDVSITISPSDSRVTYDTVSWNGTAWVNRNIGPIVTAKATGGDWELGLDGGSGGLAMSVGLGHVGSRLVLGSIGSSALDFKLAGSPDLNTDLCARMKTWSGGVKFYDQARGLADGSSTGATDGDQVMEWGCDASPTGPRYFGLKIQQRWYDNMVTAGAGSNYLKLQSVATQKWSLSDDTGQFFFELKHGSTISSSVPTMTFGVVYVDLAANTMFMSGVGAGLASISGNSSSITLTAASGVTCSAGLTANTVTANTNLILAGTASIGFNGGGSLNSSISGTSTSLTLTTTTNGLTVNATGVNFTKLSSTLVIDMASATSAKFPNAGGATISFFGVTAVTQQTLSAALTQGTTFAPAAYSQATTSGMITDIASCMTAINTMRTALRNYGLAA